MENILRHAPGAYAFAGLCELEASREHCEQVPMPEDQFCQSGMLDTCFKMLPQCSGFEHAPPCKVTEDPCCLCSYQTCPLSAAGCKRIDRQCYRLSNTAGAVAARQKKLRRQRYLASSDLRGISELFRSLDLNENGWLQEPEVQVLVKIATGSSHNFGTNDYKKLCMEMGGKPEEGVSREMIYKAYQRKHGQLYNLLISLPRKSDDEIDKTFDFGVVRETKTREVIQYEQKRAEETFALLDLNKDDLVRFKEIRTILMRGGKNEQEAASYYADTIRRFSGPGAIGLNQEEFFLFHYLILTAHQAGDSTRGSTSVNDIRSEQVQTTTHARMSAFNDDVPKIKPVVSISRSWVFLVAAAVIIGCGIRLLWEKAPDPAKKVAKRMTRGLEKLLYSIVKAGAYRERPPAPVSLI